MSQGNSETANVATTADASDGKHVMFFCPGCEDSHGIVVGKWQWNGSLVRPTFSPSILVRYPARPDAIEGFEEWREERVCHSFVTDGNIQFLGDCTHWLKGQTVGLLNWRDSLG